MRLKFDLEKKNINKQNNNNMDIEDIDSIAFKFRTTNINEKDFLINEFRRLSKTDLTDEGCCFYLDLAEWNLNTALWAYYEYATASGTLLSSSSDERSLHELPQMKFLCDITIGEGESVAPNTNFVKTWRVLNSGKLVQGLLFNQKYSSIFSVRMNIKREFHIIFGAHSTNDY